MDRVIRFAIPAGRAVLAGLGLLLISCGGNVQDTPIVPPAVAQVLESPGQKETDADSVQEKAPPEPGTGADSGNGAETGNEVASATATAANFTEGIVIQEPTAVPTSTPGSILISTTAEPPEPTPTITIPGLIGPTDYPSDVNPLTGEQVSDPRVLNRRPLAIKISNYPPQVRPQSGVNNADLVFEHYAEGVTRFTAIFYSQDADPVGSIRSGRLIDLEIPVMFDAAFGYSGSSGPVREMFRNSSFFDRIVSPDFAHGGYYRVENPGSDIEHTMFTNTSDLRFILNERGQEVPPSYAYGLSFLTEPPAGGVPAETVEIQYRTTNVFWQYYPHTGRYARWTDGVRHLDANTDEQLNFRNIIVLGAHHEDTDILEDLVGGGHHSIQIQVWGEGPVSIFRDGQRFEGVWRRENPEDMITFFDEDGQILPLAPGNSFIQVVPLGFTGLHVTP